MSGGSARTIRRYSVELWQDLVLLDVRKSTFQHLTVNWNFNVLEMASKTLHIVPGLSRTPLLFIPRYLTNIFFKNISQKEQSLEHRKSGHLKNRSWKVKVSSFVSAGTVSGGLRPTPPPRLAPSYENRTQNRERKNMNDCICCKQISPKSQNKLQKLCPN